MRLAVGDAQVDMRAMALPLARLGFNPNTPAMLWHLPERFAVETNAIDPGDNPGFLLAFVHSRAEVAEAVREVVPHYSRGGHLWVAYPKKSGSIRSDVTRDTGWDAWPTDLLAVTQVAIDEDWSALRFRYRDEIRKLTRRSEAAGDSRSPSPPTPSRPTEG